MYKSIFASLSLSYFPHFSHFQYAIHVYDSVYFILILSFYLCFAISLLSLLSLFHSLTPLPLFFLLCLSSVTLDFFCFPSIRVYKIILLTLSLELCASLSFFSFSFLDFHSLSLSLLIEKQKHHTWRTTW